MDLKCFEIDFLELYIYYIYINKLIQNDDIRRCLSTNQNRAKSFNPFPYNFMINDIVRYIKIAAQIKSTSPSSIFPTIERFISTRIVFDLVALNKDCKVRFEHKRVVINGILAVKPWRDISSYIM